jgi:sodium-dependent phosphate transporter
MFDDYLWIVVVGGIGAFWAAFGIGANDAANAFASSVGSKALSLGQAVIIASIFEFGGSVLIGSQVTDTIRKKIIDVDEFKETPELLMLGMLAVVISVAVWLILASYLELPVSTTNSTVAGVIGVGLVHGGFDSIVWYEYDSEKDFLSKFKGVVPIFASWIISPILAALFGAGLYWVSRKFVMRNRNSLKRSYIFFPVLVTITIAVNIYFIIYKGFKRNVDGEKLADKLGDGNISLIAWISGIAVGAVVYLLFVKWLKKFHENWDEKRQEEQNRSQVEVDIPSNTNRGGMMRRVRSFYKKLFSKDLHNPVLEANPDVQAIHDNAEKFDEKTEHTFSFIQVFTACADSFSHGANDVANSIGPFAAIWSIYDTMEVSSKADVPIWILCLGGAGIVIGLTLYGANLIKALGIKLSKITPSRGYSIELSSSIVVIIGSIYGVPLSTTHIQVGSTTGVALLDGKKGFNKWVLARVVFGMVSTMIFVASLSGAIYSFGSYSPNEVGY